MLSSEFSVELGALIRSLEQKVRTEPGLHTKGDEVLDSLERAIVQLISLHLELQKTIKEKGVA